MHNILYQFNEKYAPYAAVSMVSLFANNRDSRIRVYVLGEELSSLSCDRLQQMAAEYGQDLVFVDTADLIRRMKDWGVPSYRGSYAANLRMFLPYFLGDEVDRVLYLDADTIVDGSVTGLYDIDLGGKTCAMALDSIGNAVKEHHLGFAPTEDYYNSGVILFDMVAWKGRGYTDRIIRYVREGNNHFASPDQDLLNVVCKGDIKRADLRYNFQPVHYVYDNRIYFKNYPAAGYYTAEEIEAAKKAVSIYHSFRFVGEFPWNAGSAHPYRVMFDRYLAMTPWTDYVRPACEASTAMRIEKMLYRTLPKSVFLPIFCYFHDRYMDQRAEIAQDA